MLERVQLDHPDVRELPLARTRYRPSMDSDAGQLWAHAGDGVLRFHRCRQCGRFAHPPRHRCPACGGESFELSPVTGTGTLFTFTVNLHRWEPDLGVPYVIAIVTLDEGVQLTSNLIRVSEVRLSVGMGVRAVLVAADRLWIPVFEPLDAAPVVGVGGAAAGAVDG